MPICLNGGKAKVRLGAQKVKRVYKGTERVYSAGSVVTYVVGDAEYREELEEGESCLQPGSFTVPDREGYALAGWSAEPGGAVLDSMVMEGDPITLYAVWKGQPFELALDGNGWTKRVRGNNFRIGPTLTASPGYVTVSGYQVDGNAFAIGGFYKVVDTRGLSKVDVVTPKAMMRGNVVIGGVNVDYFNKVGGTPVTVSIPTTSNLQELYVYVNTGGDGYNAANMSVCSLRFHD